MNGELFYYRCVIQPGHLAFSDEPAHIFSVCGNGVVVTLRDRVRRTGAVAHCIYPKAVRGEKPTHYCADVAISSLVKIFEQNGSSAPLRLEAQIFGGGNYNGLNRRRAEAVTRSVRRIFRTMRVPVVADDTGGQLGRKIVFNTFSGETMTVRTSRIRRTDWMPERLTPSLERHQWI